MSLASKVIVKVNQFSQETSQTEAEDWLKRKTPPSKPLWVRAKEIAVKERGLAANIKASDKKKKRNARGSLSQSWWSALELEKRKAVSPIVSTMAPDNVVSTANRFFQKGHKASEKIKLDLVEGIYREMHFERKDVSSLSGSDPDPFGLLHGPSGTSGTFFDDLTNPDPILDVYGLHDQNTIMSVTPCRAISLLQSLPTDKDSVHMEKAGEANTEVKIEKPMHSLIKKEIEIDQKEPRDPMDSRRSVQEGGGVGRMMARTSFGRVMGAFKSPPEPEGGDKEFGGTVGQLLETWVWLSTSKQNEHVGGPVNMDSIVLTEYLEKKYLTPTLPRTRIIDASYREQCIQMVERCAEIIRMAQTVVEDEDAKDYFLELLLRKSDKWAGFPEPPVEVSLPAAQGAQVATSVPQTDSLVGKDSLCGSALISWQSALDALQRVCEDPTSHLARSLVHLSVSPRSVFLCLFPPTDLCEQAGSPRDARVCGQSRRFGRVAHAGGPRPPASPSAVRGGCDGLRGGDGREQGVRRAHRGTTRTTRSAQRSSQRPLRWYSSPPSIAFSLVRPRPLLRPTRRSR
mmetsp:Transcript_46236/g.59417  ORF Transcript_46236/g.59417 Transcript_46236/m.59417 type:complete len:570 (+) Transcript_46236:90-1799(+)